MCVSVCARDRTHAHAQGHANDPMPSRPTGILVHGSAPFSQKVHLALPIKATSLDLAAQKALCDAVGDALNRLDPQVGLLQGGGAFSRWEWDMSSWAH